MAKTKKAARLKWISLDPVTWIRGGSPSSLLVEVDGEDKQCCMGFAMQAYGVSIYDLRDKSYVHRVFNRAKSPCDVLVDRRHDGETAHGEIYRINDRRNTNRGKRITDKSRVRQLNTELVSLGAEFRFYLEGQR